MLLDPQVNLRYWNELARIHARGTTGPYQVDRFLGGADTLFPIESEEIGDIAGKSLLHLQCHIGLDTLSLARRGAHVTGLDFSPVAIEAARDLASRSGLEARFIESDVYDAPAATGRQYQIAYTSWGTITWLRDVYRWARTVAAVLADRGRLYCIDTHPYVYMLDEEHGALVHRYPWRTPCEAPNVFEAEVTYAGDPTPLASRMTYEWTHPLGDIISALVDAGLSITRVREHELLPYQHFKMMVDAGDRIFRLPKGIPAIPLSVTIEARKA